MNPDIPLETVLQLLTTAHVASLMLAIVASNVCLAVIETLEEAGN
jgi:hypothetical protein